MKHTDRIKLLGLGFAAGLIVAALALLAAWSTPTLNAQAPQPGQGPGPYQMSAWSVMDPQGNPYAGYFVVDTRTGLVIDSDYDTAVNMHTKYKR